MFTTTSILALAAVALAKTIEVEVGGSGLVFTPKSVAAAQGDRIHFTIDPTHNVAQANFNRPCQPSGGDALFSGDGASSFTVTVHDASKPMWFYCATARHCAEGQVFAVNPTSDRTVDMFADKAKDAGAGVAPAAVNDGSSGSGSGSDSGSSSGGGSSSSGTSESTAAAGGSPTSASSAAAATGTPSDGPAASVTDTAAMASSGTAAATSAATSATSSGVANAARSSGASGSEYLLVGLSGILAAVGLL